MSVQAETFRSLETPWEIFKKIHPVSKVCFFLDSSRYAPPNQVYSYIGMDPTLEIRLAQDRLTVSGEEDKTYPASELFPVLRCLFKKYRNFSPRHPFFTGGFVGYFGYGIAPACDRVRFRKKKELGMPDLYLGLFRDVIAYDHKRQVYHLITNSAQRSTRNAQLEKMKKYFRIAPDPHKKFQLKKISPETSKTQFERMVKRAKEYIAAGDIYQANLSQRFNFEFRGSALALYGRLRSINPSPFSSFFKIRGLQIVSSSPERLIKKRENVCETRPIAGTCPAYGPEKRLREWRQKLLQNAKERAEHLMLVDLERNDLGRVCDYRSVKVAEFMALEKYSHVVHIVSKVTGRLRKGKDAFDLLRAMFPGGTITGCPKIRCMEIIDELEPVRRGIYTGSIGYIDLRGDMDLNIVIRTLVLKGRKGHLQVGAGIVWDSDPGKEYEETLHKGEALVKALVEASTNKENGRRMAKGSKSTSPLPLSAVLHPVSK